VLDDVGRRRRDAVQQYSSEEGFGLGWDLDLRLTILYFRNGSRRCYMHGP